MSKNRPETPPNEGLVYTAYLNNIAHSISKFLNNDKLITTGQDTIWKNGPDARRQYQEKVYTDPVIYERICKPFKENLSKAVIKVIKEG